MWANWAGNETSPKRVFRPRGTDELAHCVANAERPVRAVGAGHSFAPLVAGAGTIIDVSGLEGPDVIAAGAGTARLRAGASLRSLSKYLDAVGMAFRNLGDIDVQTLAGALATGTHGTGATLPCLSAEMTGGKLMTASGEIVELRPEDVPGACVSLGLLGILLEIEMRVVPAHSLRRRVSVAPISTVLAEMHERWAAHRQFEFFCVPQTGKAIQATHDITDAPHDKPPLDLDNTALRALRIARDLGRRAPWLRRALVHALMSLQGEEDFVGSSWKVLTKPREVKFVEMEYHLPPEAARDAIAELVRMIEGQHPEIYFPVEVRQTAGDDGWLSPFQGGNRISVAVHAGASENSRRFLRDAETIFAAAGGRPHWGKLHCLNRQEVASLYPDLDRFDVLRGRLDPDGKFMTAAMDRLMMPSVARRAA